MRNPTGNNFVSIAKFDTDEIGDSSHKRKVTVTLYYPSKEWKKECPYKDAAFQKAMPNPDDNGVHSFCGLDVKLIETSEPLPVIICNHGLCGFEMESTVLCADLASNGFAVASIGHPYGSSVVTYTDGTTFIDDVDWETEKIFDVMIITIIPSFLPKRYRQLILEKLFLHGNIINVIRNEMRTKHRLLGRRQYEESEYYLKHSAA